VDESRQVVRGIRQKFAAPQADEQGEILASDPLSVRTRRSFRERLVCTTECTLVPAQASKTLKKIRVRAAKQQRREERVFLRSGELDLIDSRATLLGLQIRHQ